MRQPGGRGQPRRRADGPAPGRLPRRGRWPDREPPMRFGTPGHQHGRPRHRRRRRRGVHRWWRGVDDPRPIRPAQGWRRLGPRVARARRHDPRLAVRQPAPGRAALPLLDGRDRRERRRALGCQPRAPGCLRPREPAASRGRHRGRPVRRPDRARPGPAAPGGAGDGDSRRASASGHEPRSPRAPPAGVQGRRWLRDRRQQLRDQRRRLGRAGRRGRTSSIARAAPDGARGLDRRGRRGSGDHGRRSDPRHPQGARARGPRGGRP